MIVLDASALIDALLDIRPSAHRLRRRLVAESVVAVPDLIDPETISAVRRQWLAGRIPLSAFRDTVNGLQTIPMVRFPTRQFLPRAYELRSNVTPYDAMYLALAEGLGCPLITADARLASVPGVRCRVEVLAD